MLSLVLSFVSVAAALGGLHLSPFLLKKIAINRLADRCRRERVLCLTYDDGPGTNLTPRVLDLLEEHSACATFFLLGCRVPGNEGILARMRQQGHEMACHTRDHLNAWDVFPNEAVRDIRSGYDSLKEWMPANALFRPPYGKMVFSTWMELRRRGAPVGWWTRDSGDVCDRLPEVERVVQKVLAGAGGVVLMHDFDRKGDTAQQRDAYVLRLTRRLLEVRGSEALNLRMLGTIVGSGRFMRKV